jgi:hypothetical protein
MSFLKPEPQGNAMKSVRIMAAGAVVAVSLVYLTAPARACDERFISKCEKESAAAFAAGEAASEGGAKHSSRRANARRSRNVQFGRHRAPPRFASRRAERFDVTESAEPRRALPDTPMARRFRGFISPLPIAQHAFEALRKPHAAANDFDAAVILPPVAVAEAEAATPEPVALVAAPAAVATTPKQDKLVNKPTATMELASAESKPIVLPALPAIKTEVAKPEVAKPAVKAEIAKPPMAKAAMAEIPVSAAPVVVSEAPPAGPKPSSFSIHGLVLALCGALGAASALRFIVGA